MKTVEREVSHCLHMCSNAAFYIAITIEVQWNPIVELEDIGCEQLITSSHVFECSLLYSTTKIVSAIERLLLQKGDFSAAILS